MNENHTRETAPERSLRAIVICKKFLRCVNKHGYVIDRFLTFAFLKTFSKRFEVFTRRYRFHSRYLFFKISLATSLVVDRRTSILIDKSLEVVPLQMSFDNFLFSFKIHNRIVRRLRIRSTL